MTEEGQKQAVDTCKKFDISGVVVIGGMVLSAVPRLYARKESHV